VTKRTVLGLADLTTTIGVVLVLVGAVLVGAVALASGAAAANRTLAVSPHTGLSAGEMVIVYGTGFHHGARGVVLECNISPGQPTIVLSFHGTSHTIPVGCTDPLPVTVNSNGRFRTQKLVIQTGTLGGWETGTDSAGNSAAADSASYPCPAPPGQATTTRSCAVEYLDDRAEKSSRPITFTSTGTTTTTTTTTTTEPGGCDPVPATATAASGHGAATMTADPATCLMNGTVTTVSATGLYPSSNTNFLGTLIECNSDPTQPTIAILGTALPVSCTGALAHDWTPNATGTFTGTFPVVAGVTGPPATGTDSAGNPGSVDAANYPCPPTAAQLAAGDTCLLALGDSGGDQVSVPLSFNPDVPAVTASRR